jgi:antitoxin component YwqK of YwqJK toxin-antitoxin module
MKFTSIRFSFFFSIFSFFLISCSTEFDGKNGVKTVHFPNSTLVKQVVNYKDGKRDGFLKEYYRNGNLKIKQFYSNDSLTDSCIAYYENGNLQFIQYLKNGKKEGAWKKFNEQGKLIQEVNYKDDEKDGYAAKYSYRSLQLLEKWYYRKGEREGKQESYYLNGKRKAVIFCYGSAPCVGTEEWDETGKKIDTDFAISAREENKLLLTGKFFIYIKLSDPKPDDEVRIVTDTNSTNCLTTIHNVLRVKDEFVIEYDSKHGFVAEPVKIAASRKTALGNLLVKTKTIPIVVN